MSQLPPGSQLTRMGVCSDCHEMLPLDTFVGFVQSDKSTHHCRPCIAKATGCAQCGKQKRPADELTGVIEVNDVDDDDDDDATVYADKLQVCTRCKQVRYCGRDCQRAHWKRHKLRCVAAASQ
jgi:hypothetical protein